MGLRLEFPDKHRLWLELIHSDSERVFVPSVEPAPLGERVPVSLALPGLPVHLIVFGTVVGVRQRSPRFQSGVFLRFAPEEVDKCRRFLGLTRASERFSRARMSRRVACELPVRFMIPAFDEPFVARNVSVSGMLVPCSLNVEVGQYVEVELTLDDGVVERVGAEVSRVGGQPRVVGLRFVGPSEKLARCIDRLLDRHGREERPSSIVVADPDAEELAFIESALTAQGYEVHTARRGEEALARIRELHPGLVLLSALLPGLDGVDVCTVLRADIDLAATPVVLLSSLDEGRLHALSDKAGASDYLTTPLMPHALLRLAEMYVED